MKKLSFLFALCALALVTQSACKQDNPAFTANAATTAEQESDGAESRRAMETSSGLNYPLVEASYVGGTIPKMPLKLSENWLRRLLELRPQQRQFRVSGKTTVGADLSLAKMLSVANAFEISDFQEDEIEATRTWRSECNNVTCLGGW